jgi:transglutaminase-like putative cysteine protease
VRLTLAYLRAHGIPAPRVLGYSVNRNPIGSEYVFMEKMIRKQIEDAWVDLSEHVMSKAANL